MKRITANQFQTSERYYKLPKVLFEDYAKKYGHENFTMRNWADFQYYKDKTLDLVIAVTTAKFTLFNIQSVIDLTQKDSMDLKTWGTQKTMVYLVIPDNDTTFRFLSALFFSMVFSTLTRQADVDFKGQLPIHVRSYLDEFANVGEIPDFAEQTSTVSSWNMSLVPILQNIAQLFLIYWEGNSGDKLLERQTRASEWYYQIEKGFSQPNGGTAQSDLKALEAVRGDLFENSIPGGGDGMGYAYGQCTWGVAARINQLGLKLKGKKRREDSNYQYHGQWPRLGTNSRKSRWGDRDKSTSRSYYFLCGRRTWHTSRIRTCGFHRKTLPKWLIPYLRNQLQWQSKPYLP